MSGIKRLLALLGLRQGRYAVRVRPASADGVPGPARRRPLAEIFTPTRPRTGRNSLVGRRRELDCIVEALLEERAHVVLYSERGRGKTSLSNSVIDVLRSREVAVTRTTCNAASGFDDIMKNLMRELSASLLAVPAREGAHRGCEAALPAGRLGPCDVANLPSRLTCRTLVCVIDEFDRVSNPAVRLLLADTIKQISDRGARLLFMIVGVSDSLDQLIGSHFSIRRNIVTVLLPLMPNEDIRQLVVEGAEQAGYSFPPPLTEAITKLSRGMPYIAQLLGLRVAQAAMARGADQANEADLRRAADRLVDEAEPRVVSLHEKLTDGSDENGIGMIKALHSLSTTEQDRNGFLHASRAGAHVIVGGSPIERDCWDRLVAARVLLPRDANAATPSFTVVIGDRDLLMYVMLRSVLMVRARSEDEEPAPAPSRPVAGGASLLDVAQR